MHHDSIICTLNNWASKEGITCFFFIRYWEGGPHIRFRIKTAESSNKDYYQILSDLLDSELSSSNVNVTLTKEQYYKGHKLDGQKNSNFQIVVPLVLLHILSHLPIGY